MQREKALLMGVIQRQVIKNNLVAFLAVVIGGLAQIYLYSQNLELKGFADGLLKFMLLLGPLVGFGFQFVMIRFLPYLGEDKRTGSQRLLTRAMLIVTVNVLVLSTVNFFLGEQIAGWFLARGYALGLLETHRWEILLLLSGFAYGVMLTTHILNFQRIAVPAVFNNLFPKIGLVVIFNLTITAVFTDAQFTAWLIGLYWLITLALGALAWRMGILGVRWGRLRLQDKKMRDLYSLAGFSLFGGIGASLATHVDIISINTLVGDLATGVYGFSVFLVGVMLIPYRAIGQICAPIVARSWKEKDMAHLGLLYRDAASALYSCGIVLMVGIAVCLPEVYNFTDNTSKYAPGFIATLILGCGQLFNQMTSINDLLITYTNNYRWSVVFVLFLGAANLLLNYYFIATLGLGITGAAMATCLALFLFNLIKLLFLYHRMELLPFSWSMAYVTLFALILVAVFSWLPATGNPYLTVFLKGSGVVLSFFLFFRYTRLVPVAHRALRDGVQGVIG
ncbi:MAG: polysaccharide biosynthesis C-terminal domain-containing protein [Bacteroidota bacterium]